MSSYSIILPVKNGGEYLKECVSSILNQRYSDFKLHILENCSTDNTMGWIKSLKDERIITYPSDKPLTIEENWRRIKDIPKNEFITLIGHDDILDPDYLMVMQQLIKKYPDASLYQSHFRYIDTKGNIIRPCKHMKEKQERTEVLTNFLSCGIDIVGTGFMMRSKDYDEVGGIPPYPSLLFADFELWINLAKKSYMAVAQEEAFAFRIHQSTTTSSSDAVMLKAFERFIGYLIVLKSSDDSFDKVISKNTATLLNFYCQGFTSRLLRTDIKKRNGLRVKEIINQFIQYGKSLDANNTFKPLNNFTTRLALYVDSNFVTRNLFLLFKKIYSKPVLTR